MFDSKEQQLREKQIDRRRNISILKRTNPRLFKLNTRLGYSTINCDIFKKGLNEKE